MSVWSSQVGQAAKVRADSEPIPAKNPGFIRKIAPRLVISGTPPYRPQGGAPRGGRSGSIKQSREFFEVLDHLFEHRVVLLVHR